MTATGNQKPVGVFDSGVGGLTILRAVRQRMPYENLVYVADAAYVPYGQKSQKQIRDRALAVSSFLVEQQAKAIVVACNTATAAAIDELRAQWPIPFVGVEPAVKPAVAATRSGVIGVLATPATLASERYRSLIDRFAAGVHIVGQPCAGLAEHIELGELEGRATEQLVRAFVEPLLAKGADVIVLGCTHYPLVAHIVQRIVGPAVAVVENGGAVARELARQLTIGGVEAPAGASGSELFWSNATTQRFAALFLQLWSTHAVVQELPALSANLESRFNAAT